MCIEISRFCIALSSAFKMEGRPERIVDYFVVVGLGNNVTPFSVELVDEIGEGSLKLATPTNISPITDVALVSKKNENIPKGFK